MVRKIVKYNPAFLESEKLIENFVVRQTDLEMIVRTVHDNTAASNQHVLVIGPRGSGKTTLVRRVSVEIERDEALSKSWYPLIFAEESYNALTAADFWLESLFHVAQQTGDGRFMESYHELRRDPDEQRLAQRALGKLLDFADSIGKRILLVVENLDMLLSEFSSDDEVWSIRHTLMNEPRLMLLATAVGRFEQIDHPAKAMFEMFRIHELKSLEDEECNALWTLVAGEPLPGMQIRPIRILTGGNARLLTIIAKFWAKRSFRELLEELVDLIDEHTDYFKSHLDSMASKERKVYLALAELWSVATAREIAETARMDVNATSALLNRLVGRGRVIAEGKGKKDRRYRISEGIYNIYYLLRRRGGPSGRVKAVVRFMEVLYERVPAVKLLLDESGNLKPDQCREHMMAFSEFYISSSELQRCEIARSVPASMIDSPYLDRDVREELIAYRNFDEEANDNIKRLLEELDKQFERVHVLSFEGQFVAALDICQQIINEYSVLDDRRIAVQVAKGLVYKGITLGSMGRSDEAVAVYDEMVRRYGERQELEFSVKVAEGLVNKGFELGSRSKSGESIEVFDEVVRRYGEREELDLAVKVARALVNKGFVLGLTDRFEESVAVCDEVVLRYGEHEALAFTEQVVRGLVNKGVSLGLMGLPEESVAVYDEVVRRYGESQERDLAEGVARALLNKGASLNLMCRFEEAVEVCEDAVRRFGERKEAEFVYLILRCRLITVRNMLLLGKIEKALVNTKKCIDVSEISDSVIDIIIELFVTLAAFGHAGEGLVMLVNSQVSKQFEPLVVALNLFLGETVNAPTEILEVAKDVVKRIEERKREIELM